MKTVLLPINRLQSFFQLSILQIIVNISTNQQATINSFKWLSTFQPMNKLQSIHSNDCQHFNQSTSCNKFLQMVVKISTNQQAIVIHSIYVNISTNQQATVISSNCCQHFNQPTNYNQFLQIAVNISTNQQTIINSFKLQSTFQPTN